jgi:muramoyltetrapeptide carboxypeptidase
MNEHHSFLTEYRQNDWFLKPGDAVEIIAPASRFSEEVLQHLVMLLESWELKCHVDKALFGDDLLCANSDLKRFELLKKAIENKETKALFCARGGYGSMRIIPDLGRLAPCPPKILVGMSDITALQLFFSQFWGWPAIHAALAMHVDAESVAAVKALLFGTLQQINYEVTPLNQKASTETIKAPLIGGNLTLLQASIGTSWQVNTENRIVFLEEVGERGYRIDRMLTHLKQAGLFEKASALILGDFTKSDEPNGSSLIEPLLLRFAESLAIPVVRMKGIGHGARNYPLPLNVLGELYLGGTTQLCI